MLAQIEVLDTYQIITNLDSLRLLQKDWDDLVARSTGHYLGQTFGWALISWEIICEPRKRRLHCLVARRNGRVGLIWPFVKYRGRLHSIAHPLNSQTSEYSTVLVETCDDAEQRVANALNVLRATCACDRLEIPNVRADSILGTVLPKSSAVAVYTEKAPWVSWAGIPSWDAYFHSISKTVRSGLKRKLKRLEEAGVVCFRIVDEPAQCDAILDWMLVQKRMWLEKSQLYNDWILTPEYRAFVGASFNQFGPSGHRRIFTLELDGRIIAAELSSVDDSRVEWFMGAYDTEYGKYSPGQLLKINCLRWAFDQGLEYDFRPGNEPEKFVLSNRNSEATNYVLANAWGSIYVFGEKARIAAARTLAPELKATIKAFLRRFKR